MIQFYSHLRPKYGLANQEVHLPRSLLAQKFTSGFIVYEVDIS